MRRLRAGSALAAAIAMFSAAPAGSSAAIFVSNADGTARSGLAMAANAIAPSWSPDGTRIAILGFDAMPGPQLFAARLDGSPLTQLTRSLEDDKTAVVWSPDSSKLAFVEGISPAARLMVMNADGSGLRALAAVNEDFALPSWSPDGRRLAVLQGEAENSRLAILEADGSGRRTIAKVVVDHNEGGLPKWSPDGSRIAYVTARRDAFAVTLIRPDGTGKRFITSPRCALDPAWSPDGRRLACVGYVLGPRKRVQAAISIVKPGGRVVRTVVRANTPNLLLQAPAWSPDGNHLTYVQYASDRSFASLRVVGVDGAGAHVLTRRAPLGTTPATWAPDSRRLAFGAVTSAR